MDAVDVLDMDWIERSHREAATLIAETQILTLTPGDYEKLVALTAQAWRTGHLDGMARAQKIMQGDS